MNKKLWEILFNFVPRHVREETYQCTSSRMHKLHRNVFIEVTRRLVSVDGNMHVRIREGNPRIKPFISSQKERLQQTFTFNQENINSEIQWSGLDQSMSQSNLVSAIKLENDCLKNIQLGWAVSAAKGSESEKCQSRALTKRFNTYLHFTFHIFINIKTWINHFFVCLFIYIQLQLFEVVIMQKKRKHLGMWIF